MRLGKPETDLSEMFMVRTYTWTRPPQLRSPAGQFNFSQGGLNHDVIRAFQMAGAVPRIPIPA